MATHNIHNRGPWKHTTCGNKWFTYIRSRYFAGGFEFDTFAQAVAYARAQQANAVKNQALRDFSCEIKGPGGVMPMTMIAPLLPVKV